MRILVADDDPTLRLLVAEQLTSAGHQVVVVEDGRAALDAVLQDPPDAVVLDVMMPVLSGWDVLQALRAEPRLAGLPVALLSGRDVPDDVRRGYELGASVVVRKSGSYGDLAGLLETLHASAAARRSSGT